MIFVILVFFLDTGCLLQWCTVVGWYGRGLGFLRYMWIEIYGDITRWWKQKAMKDQKIPSEYFIVSIVLSYIRSVSTLCKSLRQIFYLQNYNHLVTCKKVATKVNSQFSTIQDANLPSLFFGTFSRLEIATFHGLCPNHRREWHLEAALGEYRTLRMQRDHLHTDMAPDNGDVSLSESGVGHTADCVKWCDGKQHQFIHNIWYPIYDMI